MADLKVLKNQRDEFLKVEENLSKKFIGKIKDKWKDMFSFQKYRRMFPFLDFLYSSFWYLVDGGASKEGSYYSDISDYDDTLVKLWQANITRNICKKYLTS